MTDRVSKLSSFVIRGGRIIDPARGVDGVGDLYIVDGCVVATKRDLPVIDGSGLIVCPGLIDIHVHLREPGGEHKETIETGTRAAASGGFTAVACMPNTTPAIDCVEVLQFVQQRAIESGFARVYPVAAVTFGRKGQQLVDIEGLRHAGAAAFSDDGVGVEDDAVMQAALERVSRAGAVVIQHCEYRAISAGGVVHEGRVSRQLGLPGLDPRSEEAMIERDLALVRETKARYHVAHISTAKAVRLVREAKAQGLPVTAEVCPHHLLLTDEACLEQDPNMKMHPPLREQSDVDACVAGLVDGTIDCIVTDHAPHAADEKAKGFPAAPPGIIGLETSLALCAKALIVPGLMDWPGLIRRMSTAPARILGLPGGSLADGFPADITLIDPAAVWRINPQSMVSKSRNTPFGGWDVVGRAVATFVSGRLRYCLNSQAERFEAIGNPLN